MTISRVQSGVPSGGQFAASSRAEAGLALVRRSTVPVTVRDVIRNGEAVRVAHLDGRAVGSMHYRLHDGDQGHMDDVVEVVSIETDPEFRGRGIAREVLTSLRDEHPDFGFTTGYFENATSRRLWEETLGPANLMAADGDTECLWCSIALFYDDEGDEDSGELCSRCDQHRGLHDAGLHVAVRVESCWFCDAERHNPTVTDRPVVA